MSAVSFSLLEKALFTLGIVGFASLYASYFSFSFHGLCIYYTFYFATNVLGHSNIEFRNARYPYSLMGYMINSPSYHAMHHARYVKNYGLITSVFDRLFNTRWTDSDKVVVRAADGKPLKKLSERP
jgi:sterol desaturase/sphingolipid hydroxylase (fatty acid hydroxylase superfamily)